jgi:hypothetical protein
MFLARGITRAKWVPKQDLSTGEISADAVTVDLRTQGNTLSFWRCHTETNGDVEEAALAIAAARGRVDKLDIVWLTDDELQADGQTLKNTIGRTPVTDLTRRHVDVCRLDYMRLGSVARRIARALENGRCRRLTKQRIITLLTAAVAQDRIDLDKLSDNIKKELRA